MSLVRGRAPTIPSRDGMWSELMEEDIRTGFGIVSIHQEWKIGDAPGASQLMTRQKMILGTACWARMWEDTKWEQRG
jgi:hypothetical protein